MLIDEVLTEVCREIEALWRLYRMCECSLNGMPLQHPNLESNPLDQSRSPRWYNFRSLAEYVVSRILCH